MLVYCIDKLCLMRGIENPHAFLKKLGFSHAIASDLLNKKRNRLTLREVEWLCMGLRVLPNNLYEYRPDKGEKHPGKHPLFVLNTQPYPAVWAIADKLSPASMVKLEELAIKLLNEQG